MNRTITRIVRFVRDREWALTIAFALSILATIQTAAEPLPDDIEPYIVGPAVLAQGWLIRARVWAEANLP